MSKNSHGMLHRSNFIGSHCTFHLRSDDPDSETKRTSFLEEFNFAKFAKKDMILKLKI